MLPFSFAIIASILATCPEVVLAWSTNSTGTYPTSTSVSSYSVTTLPGGSISTTTGGTCITITSTRGSLCPPNSCPQADCALESTITLSCGCPSIFTTTACETKCVGGCQTLYDTIYLPCAYSPTSSPTSTTSSMSSESSNSVSSGTASTKTSSTTVSATMTVAPTTTYGNTSTVTITSCTTLTTCPPHVTCTGQTSTFTGSNGPIPCSSQSTCSCVLPGGTSVQTVTEATTTTPGFVSTTSGAPGSASSSPSGVLAAGAGRLGWAEGGVLAGLAAAVLGMM